MKKIKKSVKKSRKVIKAVKIKKQENRSQLSKNIIKSIEQGSDIKWFDDMSMHEGVIDRQHKTLLSKINELIKNSETNDLGVIRGLLEFLGKYIIEHFAYEENYMKMIDYPKKDFLAHQKIHKSFVKFYLSYKKEFDKLYSSKKIDHNSMKKLLTKAKKYLGEWLVSHIIVTDHKYLEFAKKNPGKLNKSGKIDVKEIASEIKQEMISDQRKPAEGITDLKLKTKNKGVKNYVFTGVEGFDQMLEEGIPKGNALIIAGGAGSGKTIFCLQTLINKANEGQKCLYMTLEENEEKLIEHMEDFGWNPRELIKKNKLKILRINPFDITRNVDALLAKQKGELLIDVEPVIMPKDFSNPDFIVIDSLTAIASAFTGKEDSYRIYIEQLFRFLEKTGATSFLITETEQVPKIFSQSGVEEFLADGVIVLYAIKHGNVRENAIEILKLRGAGHKKKIVALQITNSGIVIYPEQEVFSEI